MTEKNRSEVLCHVHTDTPFRDSTHSLICPTPRPAPANELPPGLLPLRRKTQSGNRSGTPKAPPKSWEQAFCWANIWPSPSLGGRGTRRARGPAVRTAPHCNWGPGRAEGCVGAAAHLPECGMPTLARLCCTEAERYRESSYSSRMEAMAANSDPPTAASTPHQRRLLPPTLS